MTNLQFFVGGFTLFAVILFIMLLSRRRKSTPPFGNYFCSKYDDPAEQEFFSERNQWTAHIEDGGRPSTPIGGD